MEFRKIYCAGRRGLREVGWKDRAQNEGGKEAENVGELTVVAATALSSTTVGVHVVG